MSFGRDGPPGRPKTVNETARPAVAPDQPVPEETDRWHKDT